MTTSLLDQKFVLNPAKELQLQRFPYRRVNRGFHPTGLTVPSGTVAINLTDFVVMVRLEHLPVAFWNNVTANGSNVRVYAADGSTPIPFDLVRINTAIKEGLLFFKAALLSALDNTFKITLNGNGLLASGDTYGRNATWDDYHRVYVRDSLEDRTGNGSNIVVTNEATVNDFTILSTSPNVTAHQGVACDGTHYYVFGTNTIKKYTLAWALVGSESDVITAAGLTGVNHMSDSEVLDGVLYLSIQQYPETPRKQIIARFNASDLSFIGSDDITAGPASPSGIGYNPADGYFYTADYDGAGTTLYKLDPNANFASVGTLTLSTALTLQQGLVFWNGKLYIGRDGDLGLWQVALDGTVERRVWTSNLGGTTGGVGQNVHGLVALTDPSVNGTVSYVHELRAVPVFNLGGSSSYAKMAGVSLLSTWTMGGTFTTFLLTGASPGLLSYQEDVTGDGTRETLALRLSAGPYWGQWNNTDSWLQNLTIAKMDAVVHLSTTHDGTTSRTLHLNGVGTTDSGCVIRPVNSGSGVYTVMVGTNVGSATCFKGHINYIYLRNGELSASWLAAEDKSWRTPDTFYVVT